MTDHPLAQYIDGAFVAPASTAYLDDIDPATGDVIARVPAGDAADIDHAVAAASRAFDAWRDLPAAERSRYLLAIAQGIEDRAAEFARAESLDTGKPISAAAAVDIPRAVHNFRFFATAILHTRSDAHPTDDLALNYTLRRPHGVAGLISPWNLPLYLLSWKVAPALATGNTAVAKPSELTPLTAHHLAEVCDAVGLPAGVFNLVHGRGSEAGVALVEHVDVPTLSFTGGTATGADIARRAAPRFKKLALEMGGKNPTVVFADADLDQAVRESLRAAFANQGQICLCGSRLLVERSIYAAFLERFVAGARGLTPGDPADPATTFGALISRDHREKVLGYIDLARTEGGTVLCGGEVAVPAGDRCRNGYYVLPTVITDLDPACRTQQEEIFGPVVTVTPFDTEDEAVALANGTRYGLAASVWTTAAQRAHRVAARIDCGTVWVNCWMLRDLRVPFGGMKDSGLGREGGEEALRFFTEPKNVCLALGEPSPPAP